MHTMLTSLEYTQARLNVIQKYINLLGNNNARVHLIFIKKVAVHHRNKLVTKQFTETLPYPEHQDLTRLNAELNGLKYIINIIDQELF